jgi:hypothetical protein
LTKILEGDFLPLCPDSQDPMPQVLYIMDVIGGVEVDEEVWWS